jgi:hypothetical protein
VALPELIGIIAVVSTPTTTGSVDDRS